MANNVHHTSIEGQAPTDIESQSSNSDENQIVFVLPEVKSPNRWNGEMACKLLLAISPFLSLIHI